MPATGAPPRATLPAKPRIPPAAAVGLVIGALVVVAGNPAGLGAAAGPAMRACCGVTFFMLRASLTSSSSNSPPLANFGISRISAPTFTAVFVATLPPVLPMLGAIFVAACANGLAIGVAGARFLTNLPTPKAGTALAAAKPIPIPSPVPAASYIMPAAEPSPVNGFTARPIRCITFGLLASN